MAARSALITIMIKAAEKASFGLVRDFGEVEKLQVSKKGPADFVSTADQKAEKAIRAELEKARPGYGFMMEEGGIEEGTDPEHRWIIDPLDGTTNFLHGIPHFAVSIALQKGKDIVAAVVMDPINHEVFWAEKGVGAYVNDFRLRVSGRRELSACVIGCGIPHIGVSGKDRFVRQLAAVMTNSAGVRRFGAAALDLAYVAAGRFDGFFEEGLKNWDIAAGLLLVREAGGFVTDLAGSHTGPLASGEVVAGNDGIQERLRVLLKTATDKGVKATKPTVR
jgi:myo-inositol-1(or 4)-monophosphatase